MDIWMRRMIRLYRRHSLVVSDVVVVGVVVGNGDGAADGFTHCYLNTSFVAVVVSGCSRLLF